MNDLNKKNNISYIYNKYKGLLTVIFLISCLGLSFTLINFSINYDNSFDRKYKIKSDLDSISYRMDTVKWRLFDLSMDLHIRPDSITLKDSVKNALILTSLSFGKKNIKLKEKDLKTDAIYNSIKYLLCLCLFIGFFLLFLHKYIRKMSLVLRLCLVTLAIHVLYYGLCPLDLICNWEHNYFYLIYSLSVGIIFLIGVSPNIIQNLNGLSNKKDNLYDLKNNIDYTNYDWLGIDLNNMINGLREEQLSVRNRASLNLFVGVITTLGGLFILFTLIFDSPNKMIGEDVNEDNLNQILIISILPRIVLSIFIELIAFYFFKLYKGYMIESKYYQNELINIQSKFIALKVALVHDSNKGSNDDEKSMIKDIITELLSTERNFILESGQSSLRGEELRNLKDSESKLLALFSNFFANKK